MVFVTGATGILGRLFVLDLLKRGKTVRAAKRKTSDLAEVRRSFRFYTDNPDRWFEKIEWIDVDFEDQDSIQTAIAGVTEIYHCAGVVSFNPKDRREMLRTNVTGTFNLLAVCENSSVQKFCHISSVAVLDGVNESGMMDENSDFNLKLQHSDYALSKHLGEMEVWRAAAEGLNTVIINPGIIIGSGNWHQSSGNLFGATAKNFFTFSGGASYVDVRDVVKMTVELMERNTFGERFIMVSESVKYYDLSATIRRKMGLSEPKIISAYLLKILEFLALFLSWLIPKLKMVNSENIKSVSTFTPISSEKIQKQLGMEFIPFEESISFHLKNYEEDRKDLRK